MKVTSIALFNDQIPEPLILSFRDPANENPFQASSIDGLGAEDIMWGLNGSGYEAKLRKRDVVVRVGLNPQWGDAQTYSTLRDQLYRIIQSTRSGELSIGFKNGNTLVAVLSGQVVKMEAEKFSKTPDVTFTLQCKNPMLVGPSLVNVDVTDLDPHETVIDDQISTMPHGMTFQLRFNSNATSFTLTGDDDWTFKTTPIGIGGHFETDDILACSSLFNEKGLWLKRGGSTWSILDSIAAKSVWPIIFPRPNTFKCSGNVEWVSIKHPTAYWGV